jgi:isocitrate/isopropylmalate dehydrogenase
MTIPITVAYGDGVGPEIMDAVLHILRESGAPLVIETIEIGQRIYNMESNSGILPSAFNTLRQSKILLKGPTASPEGNEAVTGSICKSFGIDLASLTVRECEFIPGVSAASYANESFALFEPVQEILPEMKGRNRANPSAMILAAIMMLEHIGLGGDAALIHAAWRKTITQGIHTRDLYGSNSEEKVGTSEFAEAVAARLHQSVFSN